VGKKEVGRREKKAMAGKEIETHQTNPEIPQTTPIGHFGLNKLGCVVDGILAQEAVGVEGGGRWRSGLYIMCH
jgi:hypothetical protein